MDGKPNNFLGINLKLIKICFRRNRSVTFRWETIRENLQELLGLEVFKKWIIDIDNAIIDGERVILSVPSRFVGDYIIENYSQAILKSFSQNGAKVSSVKFQVHKPKDGNPKTQKKNSTTPPDSKGQSGLRPDRRCTFSNFVVGESNGKAHTAAWQIANGSQNFKSLYLYGHVGLGKSHLLHAVCWMLMAKNPEMKTTFLTGQLFSDYYVKANQNGVLLKFREKLRTANVLLVDDIQFILGKKGTTQEFDLTLSHFLSDDKLVIMTGLQSIEEMKELGPRINSRLLQGLVEKLEPPDYDLRLRILHQKLAEHKKEGYNFEFEDGVLEFIANQITGDVRRMEGALHRIFVSAEYLRKRTFTLEMAGDTLSDIIKFHKPPTVEDIMKAVAKHHGIGVDEIKGPRRLRNIVRARQIGIYLAHELTSKSLPHIGSCFDRDRTTIIHSIKQINILKDKDKEIDYTMSDIRRSLRDA